MNANAEDDAPVLGQADVTLGCSTLQFDHAPHCVDHAAKFGEKPVAGALDDAAFVNGDGRVDQVAAQRPQSGERAILVNRGETAESDDVGDEDRSDLSVFGHGALTRHADSTGKA
jgi:hypothetical protein